MRNRTGQKESVLSTDFSDESAILAMSDNLSAVRDVYKYALERQWHQNIAWYMGLQNLIWFDSTHSLNEPKAPSWRVRMIVNHLQGMVRTIGSKIYRSAPEWDVLPATTDALDLQTAQISNQLLQANWYRMLMDEQSIEVLLWMLTTGNGFIQHTWDPDAGALVFLPGEDGIEQDVDPDLTIGETKAEAVAPFEMLIDPRAVKFRDAIWCRRSRRVRIDELREDFPRAEEISVEHQRGDGKLASFQEHLKRLVNGKSNAYTSGTLSEDLDTTIVHELYIRPRSKSKRLKRGKFIVIAGNKVLNGGGKGVDFPYLHGELPFAHFMEVPVPGRLWGTSTLEQLMPLQANYNRTLSQIIENKNLMSRPKWMNPKGSGILDTALTSEPGEVVDHNPGLAPTQADVKEIPSYVQNMLVYSKQDMEDISGIHEVSRAEAPGEIRSGRGVLALVEQDESRLNTVVRMFEAQISRLGRQNLSVSAQYVTENRLAKIVGENDELLLFNYTGNKLLGPHAGMPGVNYFDVRVKTVAGLPHSRAAQQELLGQLVELGALKPQEKETDKRLMFKLLSIGTTRDHLDRARVHRSRQLQEIERMVQGEPIRAEQWHDHGVHLEVINEFRNSARYDILPPEAKAALQQHAQQHKEWVAYNAVEPRILTQKAAIAAMVQHQVGDAAQQAQNPGINVLGGGGSSPPAKPQAQQLPQGSQVPAQVSQGAEVNG